VGIHQRTHPTYVEGCFACRVSTVGFGAGAMPFRRQETFDAIKREERWAPDIAAYRALRKEGLQPPQVDGARERMMTASTREEVEGLPKLWKDREEILANEIPQPAEVGA